MECVRLVEEAVLKTVELKASGVRFFHIPPYKRSETAGARMPMISESTYVRFVGATPNPPWGQPVSRQSHKLEISSATLDRSTKERGWLNCLMHIQQLFRITGNGVIKAIGRDVTYYLRWWGKGSKR